MLLRSKLLLSLAVLGFCAAVIAPRPAAALVILDNFDEANNPVSTPCTHGNVCTPGSTTSNVGDFMAVRSSEVRDLAILTIDGSGILTYAATDPMNTADLLLTYSLSDQDVTGGGLNLNFVLKVLSVSGISSVNVRITDIDADFADVPIAVGPTPNSYFAPLSDFTTANGNLDLDHVDEISLNIVDQNGTLVLDFVLVPEPSTGGMMLLGLLGLARAGRRPIARV